MAIKKIKISNFKSFDNLEIKLGKFNVLIGANAAGKTNFIQIFKFLKDTVTSDLENAISMQGGAKYFRNVKIGPSNNFVLEITSDQKYGFKNTEKSIMLNIYEGIYTISVKFKSRGENFEIVNSKIRLKCDVISLKKLRTKEKKRWHGEIVFSIVNGKVGFKLSGFPQEMPVKEEDIFPPFFKDKPLPPKSLVFDISHPFILSLIDDFNNISIYDFDPKLAKNAFQLPGKIDLEEDGGNLVVILKNILENPNKKRKLSNLIKDLLPYVADLNIEKFAGKSLFFNVREIYFQKYLPSFLISDGTINITALIIALYFEEKALSIIEEPERNIHPYLISKVVEMMKDASQKKQIIITTHNPEMVKHVALKNILLIARNKEGFSTISRPGEKEEIKTFLKNEIGIDELYIQNLLEI